ncbi:MAG: hypothetical protein UD936_10600, partial [Acutalibacteraceae bacterium]|nr:hypothetical protein [Acutalibacteraceae bacterium]
QKVVSVKKREEAKKTSLSLVYNKLDKFISDVGDIDNKVAAKIESLKKDFYSKYKYLKPDSEKNLFDYFNDLNKGIWDGLCNIGKAIAKFAINVANWCKENWELLVVIGAAILAVVLIVVACVVTGGVAILLVFGIFIAIGIAGQLVSDLAIWAITGEWKGTLEDYVGAAFGGIIDAALFVFTGGASLGPCSIPCGMISSFLSTMFTESLKNLTGKQDKSFMSVYGESLANAGLSILTDFLMDQIISTKFIKSVSDTLKEGISEIPFMQKFFKGALKCSDISFEDAMEKVLRGVKLSGFSIADIGFVKILRDIPKSSLNGILEPITTPIKKGVGKYYEGDWGYFAQDFWIEIFDGTKSVLSGMADKALSIVKFGMLAPIKIEPIVIDVNLNVDVNVNVNAGI